MNNKIINLTITLVFSFLVSSCSIGQLSEASHLTTDKEYSATNASDITIFLSPPEQKFIIIGLVDSNGLGFSQDASKDRAMIALKAEAAKIGSQAIIITSSKTEVASGFDGEPAGKRSFLSGKAIRFDET